MCRVILCLFGLFLVFSVVVGVKKGDPGACPSRRNTGGRGQGKVRYSCCSGWTYVKANNNCKPICIGCENGECVAPGQCQCKSPLVLVGNKCVEPNCDEPCFNAQCSGVNQCSCNSGFVQYNATHCKPNCQEGYILNNITMTCEPHCDNPCVNGICSGPNICTCNEGYTKNNETPWNCRADCDGCENGECISPGNCQCHVGYTKTADQKCSPVCEEECINGLCTEPGFCTCHIGYEKDKGNDTACHPVCKPGCENAVCESPNSCACLPGYEMTSDYWICKAKCENCTHGDCVGSNLCQCHVGYKMLNGTCEPVCSKRCKNGVCVAPDQCTCFEDYVKSETDPTECRKPCKGPCEMGHCTMHGECICKLGYNLRNETCVTAKVIDCGECQNNCTSNPCLCDDGQSCYLMPPTSEEQATEIPLEATFSPMLMWDVLGGVCLLLLGVVAIVMVRVLKKRRNMKSEHEVNDKIECSVLYTVPDTLIRPKDVDIGSDEDRTMTRLLKTEIPEDV